MTLADDLATSLRHALDVAAWAREALGFAPDRWQEVFLRSTRRQVLMCCSRQSGKSTVAAILAAHTVIFRPPCLVLLISGKGQRQSVELLAKVVGFIRQIPGVELTGDNEKSIELATGSRVLSLPGDAGAIRGFSAPAMIIEDEAAWCLDEMYQTVRPMLATVANGRLILMSTPNGRRGHFFAAWHGPADSWERFTVTANDCPRITQEHGTR